MSIRHIKKHPRRAELIEEGALAPFYGVGTGEMDRDDLLMMIGYLGNEKAQREKARLGEREILALLRQRPLG